MTDGAAIGVSSTRLRAISLASGALIVASICLGLIALSRVSAYLEQRASIGVEVEIAARAPTRVARQRPAAPLQTTSPSAAPVETVIPVDRPMLARTLRCFDLPPGSERPPECPPPTAMQLEAAGGEFPGDARDPRALMTNAERRVEAFMDMGPCQGVCVPIGSPPDPPSRTPQQICADGGVGPCGTPIFREDEVQRRPHTQ